MFLLVGLYALAMWSFVEENKSFKVEKQINYPVEKVFAQFNNLQNLTRWNIYFSGSKKMKVQYYAPYEGQGAALSFEDPEEKRNGEMAIRFVSPGKGIKYQLFEGKKQNPQVLDVKFLPLPNNRTKIIWLVRTPKLSLMNRYQNLFTEESFSKNIDQSMAQLSEVMANRVDKESQAAAIKYDSLMVGDEGSKILLGVNVSASNKKDALIASIVMNHNKVYNFITTDLGKRDDEVGLPILTTDPGNLKSNEVSYFYGMPISKKVGLSDNNFSFKTINASKYYYIYYKGKYGGRQKAIQQLIQRATKDTMRNGELQQWFLEPPSEGDVVMKIMLPVYR